MIMANSYSETSSVLGGRGSGPCRDMPLMRGKNRMWPTYQNYTHSMQ